jgi:hypothetical protein
MNMTPATIAQDGSRATGWVWSGRPGRPRPSCAPGGVGGSAGASRSPLRASYRLYGRLPTVTHGALSSYWPCPTVCRILGAREVHHIGRRPIRCMDAPHAWVFVIGSNRDAREPTAGIQFQLGLIHGSTPFGVAMKCLFLWGLGVAETNQSIPGWHHTIRRSHLCRQCVCLLEA